MSNPKKQLPRRTDEDWYRLIMDCRKSGLSDAQFCRANGIPTSSFSSAIKRLRGKSFAISEVSDVDIHDLTLPSFLIHCKYFYLIFGLFMQFFRLLISIFLVHIFECNFLQEVNGVELIDGVFYDMSAPSTIHRIRSLNMSIQIKKFIDKNKGNCVVLISPCDVQLDMDNKTMVQPDVMIICQKDKIVKKNIFGCPDFIVEVLSSTTRRKDMSLKLAKYENAGVKEYWIVDPDKLKIIVYDFAHDFDVSIYGFEDKVPVGLYDGKLQIDFKPIFDEIDFLL